MLFIFQKFFLIISYFQGVIVGFLTSLVFNVWLVIGKAVTHSGNQEYLSLSTDGCPGNQSYTTTEYITTSTSNYLDDM